MFNENFNFRTHIDNVCKLSYYRIRDLLRIRKHLNLDQAKRLASALVSSRLDYCNSLLHGVAVRDMLQLQRVQTCLARVVTRAGRFAPSTPPLSHSLHWLPISFRIQFKILTLTHKTLSSGKPSYLANLIHLSTPNRYLRFNKGPLLSAPKSKPKTGTRVFSVCAPSLWNKLPLFIRSSESLTYFRQRLKTHLSGLAYPSYLVDFPISWWRIWLSSGLLFSVSLFWAWSALKLDHAANTGAIEVFIFVLYCINMT